MVINRWNDCTGENLPCDSGRSIVDIDCGAEDSGLPGVPPMSGKPAILVWHVNRERTR